MHHRPSTGSVHAFSPFSASWLKIPLPHTFNIFNNVKIILSPTDLKFFQPDHEIISQTKVHLGIDSPRLKVHFLPEYSENVGKC